jgi:glycosyltransferase involved in cell wall biosynthesis
MKVAIVGGSDGASREVPLGAYTHKLAAALTERGEQVTVYNRRTEGAQQAFAVADAGVGPAKVLSATEALPYASDFATSLDNMWALDPPDVVHAHGWLSGLAAQLAARHRGLPVVQSFHGFGGANADSEQARLEPLLAKSAAWVSAGHTAELELLIKHRRGRQNLSVLPWAVDTDYFTPGPPAAVRPYRIVYFGSDSLPHMGFEAVIRALQWVPKSELMLVATAAPENDTRDVAHKLAEDLGVSERVRLLDGLNGDTAPLPDVMRSADVVVWTPTATPTAAVALQAMASGVAVIGTAVDALSDVVVHNVTGILITHGMQRDLVAGLKMLQAQEFRRRGMGSAGRARVQSRYTWSRVAADSQVIYQRVAMREPGETLVTAPVSG